MHDMEMQLGVKKKTKQNDKEHYWDNNQEISPWSM